MTFMIGIFVAAIAIQLFLIFVYNKPQIEVRLIEEDEYDVYRVYLNYIKYKVYFIEDCECIEREDKSIKLFSFKRKNKV